MNIEDFFHEIKGLSVQDATNASARYTAIDICRFAKAYHESENSTSSLQNRLFDLANDFAVAKQGDIAVRLHSIKNEL